MVNIMYRNLIDKALKLGFNAAAFIDVKDMLVVPEYRKYCEVNLCHCYNVVPACPPQCGTVEEMIAKMNKYSQALVLQTIHDSDFKDDPQGALAAKSEHNELVDRFLQEILIGTIQGNKDPEKNNQGDENPQENYLRMAAGPYKHYSCMSAYCIDVANLADKTGMDCWMDDGKCRLFSLILLH